MLFKMLLFGCQFVELLLLMWNLNELKRLFETMLESKFLHLKKLCSNSL